MSENGWCGGGGWSGRAIALLATRQQTNDNSPRGGGVSERDSRSPAEGSLSVADRKALAAAPMQRATICPSPTRPFGRLHTVHMQHMWGCGVRVQRGYGPGWWEKGRDGTGGLRCYLGIMTESSMPTIPPHSSLPSFPSCTHRQQCATARQVVRSPSKHGKLLPPPKPNPAKPMEQVYHVFTPPPTIHLQAALPVPVPVPLA